MQLAKSIPFTRSSSSFAWPHGYLPRDATYKKMKLAKSITSGSSLSDCEAFKAAAINPSMPMTTLTTRMNGKTLVDQRKTSTNLNRRASSRSELIAVLASHKVFASHHYHGRLVERLCGLKSKVHFDAPSSWIESGTLETPPLTASPAQASARKI